EGTGRTVTILTPNGFSPNDAFLLGKHAKCSVSSGDLSMSDVLAAGRIPVTDIESKRLNACAILKHLNIFSKKYPEYEKQVECIKHLRCAMPNIANHEHPISDIICELKLFGNQEWSKFEQSYIDYLRSQPGIFLEDNLCNAVKIRLEIKEAGAKNTL
ncbi:MAG: hypothetical protein KAG53_07030, partial [Endozoicomonadaceae bacterium]|nr:hypothetical protein [Endozoicomonadaceae bacterium]